MRKITPEHVWEAYYRLWLYAKTVGTTGGLKLPFQLSKQFPVHKADLIHKVTEQIRKEDASYIIQCSPLYYCYLYLFVQLLRCSQPNAPRFVDAAKGWKNLSWYPLIVLKGRPEVANRTWHGWHSSHVLGRGVGEDILSLTYPMLDDSGTVNARYGKTQFELVQQIAEMRDINYLEVIVNYQPTGLKRAVDEESKWHPWLLLALPEAWGTELNLIMAPRVIKLIESPSDWESFCDTFIPMLNAGLSQRGIRARILNSIDMVFMLKQDTKLTSKWRQLRRRLLPNPNE